MPPVTPAETATGRLEDFDPRSGFGLERAVFNPRIPVLLLCALATIVLAVSALRLTLNASFEKTIPAHHPYIVNFLENRKDMAGRGTAVRIAVEARQGNIYEPRYLEQLKQLNDEVLLLPGVDRPFMKSLWTPNTRWTAVTEDGLDGGQVIPPRYDGSPAKLEELRLNVQRSGEIGQLVAADGGSTIIHVPLLPKDKALDYAQLSERLEHLRAKYRSDAVELHITGFAKVAGDLIEGLLEVLGFFVVALLISAAMVYVYNRDVRSTLLVVLTSLTGVLWQLGLLPLLGYSLNPYSMLIPFLVFAIGMSHGAQKMNGILQDIGRGIDRYVAARFTFRRLFLAGLTALLADAVGFAVLLVIDIPVIRELAIAASLGVLVLVFTNLILLPVLLSYVGVSRRAAERAVRQEAATAAGQTSASWRGLATFTEGRRATLVVATAAVLAGVGLSLRTQLQIGDLDPGAPELRADSRYNRDVAFLTSHYGASSDVFAVMVKTPEGSCSQYEVLRRVDQLEWELMDLPGVESTQSMARLQRRGLVGLNAARPLWYELLRNQDMLNTITARAPRELYNEECNLLTMYAYLRDHRAETLQRVVDHVEGFAKKNNDKDANFLLAAGSAGIDATTNIVVRTAWYRMLFMVYGPVALLCFSSIKFQADLGLLLAFMFLLNMLGALVLVPALARFLLPGAREGLVAAPMVSGDNHGK